jgi:hypothetical protein
VAKCDIHGKNNGNIKCGRELCLQFFLIDGFTLTCILGFDVVRDASRTFNFNIGVFVILC